METVLKSDIFFFIVAVESVLVTMFVCVALFYIIRTGREFNRIVISLREQVSETEMYVTELKERLDANIFFRVLFPKRKKDASKNISSL